jgi:hypothetical protein
LIHWLVDIWAEVAGGDGSVAYGWMRRAKHWILAWQHGHPRLSGLTALPDSIVKNMIKSLLPSGSFTGYAGHSPMFAVLQQ